MSDIERLQYENSVLRDALEAIENMEPIPNGTTVLLACGHRFHVPRETPLTFTLWCELDGNQNIESVSTEEMHCPACKGTGERGLPVGDEEGDIFEYPCPICKPWARGFPGERAFGRWVIPPYAPGETPMWNGFVDVRPLSDQES